MQKILVVVVLVLLTASSGAAQSGIAQLGDPQAANTQRDRVGGDEVDLYSFLSSGGQAIFTLMWLNAAADLVMALVCSDGIEDPLAFGAAAGGLEKFARMDVGIPAGLVCVLAISAALAGSQYFLSFLAEAEGVAAGFGRVNALPQRVSDDHMAVLEKQIEQLKRLAR